LPFEIETVEEIGAFGSEIISRLDYMAILFSYVFYFLCSKFKQVCGSPTSLGLTTFLEN
jgi:hypothetical protein